MAIWKVPGDVLDLINEVKTKHHQCRLEKAAIVACFDESKPFIKNKINLGKVSKFSSMAKLWQHQKYDFCLTFSADLWAQVLKDSQRLALIDLQLARCGVEYIAETIEENGKKKVVKDEWGRIQFTDQILLDDEGSPKWKVEKLDIEVYNGNIRRFGLWYEELQNIGEVIKNLE